MSLEHAIPKFLGGAYAPKEFELDRVCKCCNNLLGLFVDGSVSRTSWVHNWLVSAARAAYNPDAPTGLPLVCMGTTELVPPGMAENEVCESWLGPQGEQIYWIRPHDERYYWYSGGDPIAAKKEQTRAYFYVSVISHADPLKMWLAFRDAFEGDNVRKIMGTNIVGADPKEIGFSPLDDVDQERIAYFAPRVEGNPSRLVSLHANLEYDHRFMSKLALGVGYALFGEQYLNCSYTYELRRGIWFRNGADPPRVMGQPQLAGQGDKRFLEFTGIPDAVTLIVLRIRGGVALTLNLGQQLSWKMLLCQAPEIPETVASIGLGEVIVLYRYLKAGVRLSWPEFFGHRHGGRPDARLVAIESRLTLPTLSGHG